MNARQFLRTGLLVVLAQIAVALLGIVALRVYTGLVIPAVFGASNLVLSALGLGLQLFVAGFTAALLRFHGESAAAGRADAFTHDTLRLALRSIAVFAVLLLIVLCALDALGIMRFAPAAMLAAIAWLFAMTVRNVVMSRIQAERRQITYAALQLLEAVLLLCLTYAALRVSATLAGFMVGQLLAVIVMVLLLSAVQPATRAAFRSVDATGGGFGAKAWAYGAPFAPMACLSWLANLGDRYTLGILLGAGAAGRYVAPFSIASRGMLLANSALTDLFRPVLFDAENRRDAHAARKTFLTWLLAALLVSCAGVLILYFLGSWIAGLLLAPEYRSGATGIMLWVSLGYTVAGLMQVVENRLLSLGHSGRLLLPMTMGAVANVAFSVVLIRSNGLVGAAQATCASFVCQGVATVGFLVHALARRPSASVEDATVETASIL
jgi:O-antigen/teichoic acid export membrane protein